MHDTAAAVPLSQRSLHLGSPVKPMKQAQIIQMTRLNGPLPSTFHGAMSVPTSTGTTATPGGSVQSMARFALFSGGRLPGLSGRGGATARYLALHSALNFLDEDSDEDDAMVLLTPVRGSPGNARELADMLQQSGDDAEALAELLEDVEGLPKDPQELYEALRHIRYEPAQLAAYLREKQGLPADRSALRRMREQIEDAVRQLESTDGSVIRASINAADAASLHQEPPKFLDTYTEVIKGKSFVETLLNMTELSDAANLRMSINNTIKALGDDINAANPSRDPAFLSAVLTNLSNMHVSNTLLELLDTLVERLQRMNRAVSVSSRHEKADARG